MVEEALQYLILFAVLAACILWSYHQPTVGLTSDKARDLLRARVPLSWEGVRVVKSEVPETPLISTSILKSTTSKLVTESAFPLSSTPASDSKSSLSSASYSSAPPRPIRNVKDLLPEEIALMQFDSRYPLKDYWQSSAMWNSHYCRKHGHTFIYYALRKTGECVHDPSGERLADPWCKVKAMLRANSDFPKVQLFVYLDSDAVLDQRFENSSMLTLIGTMQDKLSWDIENRPVVFNQDGPCWWCKLVSSVGYNFCLNAGTVLWRRHPHSDAILRAWWAAAMDEQLEGNPLRRRFRLKWPWEQDRQMAVYNRTPEHIQIASQPDKPFMDMRAGHHDWCLSHLPKSGCFISHHCENLNSKLRMMGIYDGLRSSRGSNEAVTTVFL